MLDTPRLVNAIGTQHTLVLSPLAVTWGLVVDSGEELKLVQWHLLRLDAQLVVQFPLRCALHTQDSCIQLRASLSRDAQRMGAAGIGPHVGEGNLLGGALLQEQALIGIEQENGKGTMKEVLVDVAHQVACSTGSSLAWFLTAGRGPPLPLLAEVFGNDCKGKAHRSSC